MKISKNLSRSHCSGKHRAADGDALALATRTQPTESAVPALARMRRLYIYIYTRDPSCKCTKEGTTRKRHTRAAKATSVGTSRLCVTWIMKSIGDRRWNHRESSRIVQNQRESSNPKSFGHRGESSRILMYQEVRSSRILEKHRIESSGMN